MGTGDGDNHARRLPDNGRRLDPTVRQLRLFLILAEELHFGAAAARLYVTQPALSQQIRALESRVGVRLFERADRAVRLTEAGRELVTLARETIGAFDGIRGMAQRYAGRQSGRVTLGYIGGEAAMPYTHAIIAELRASHPRVGVDMRAVTFDGQICALIDGTIDVALLRLPVPAEIQTLPLATEPRVACLPANDPLADRACVSLAELTGRAMVRFPSEAPRVWRVDWTLDSMPDGGRPRSGPVVSDIEGLMLAVASGEAIAFLPAAARHLYPRPGIAYIDVTDLPRSTAVLAWLPVHDRKPLIAAVIAAATKAADRH